MWSSERPRAYASLDLNMLMRRRQTKKAPRSRVHAARMERADGLGMCLPRRGGACPMEREASFGTKEGKMPSPNARP